MSLCGIKLRYHYHPQWAFVIKIYA